MASHISSTIDEEAAHWFARLRADDVSRRDRRRFEQWLERDDAHQTAFAECAATWEAMRNVAADDTIVAMRKEALDLVAQPGRSRWNSYGWAAAAAILLMLFGAAFLVERPATTTRAARSPALADAGEVYRTKVGQRSTISLTDGSVVELNTDSLLKVDLGKKMRRFALLRGQALFRVAHDRARPFVVEADGKSVTALGTVFDVDIRTDELRVTLIEGEVAVRRNDASAASPANTTRTLEPGQQLIAHAQRPFEIRSIDPAEVVSWRSGRVMFDDERLGDVLQEINRYSDRKLVLGDPRLADLRISGVFHTGSVEGFTAALDASFPVQSRLDRSSNVIVMMPR